MQIFCYFSLNILYLVAKSKAPLLFTKTALNHAHSFICTAAHTHTQMRTDVWARIHSHADFDSLNVCSSEEEKAA